MKIKLLLLSMAVVALFSCNKTNSPKGNAGSGSTDLKSEIDSVSYSLGADIGSKLKESGVEGLNYAAFSNALLGALNGDSAKITPEEGMKVINNFFQNLYTQKLEKNKKDGEAFLEANKTKEGVKVTDSGIQYIILKEGDGPIPVDTSIVKVNYEGTLIDGTVFDSSYEHGKPAEFPVKGVIKGWQEVLKMMPVGSKWKVFIPTELAYGQNVRRGGKIGPNMALIFDMELLEIVPPKDKEQPKHTN